MHGVGVGRDLRRAYNWLRLAFEKGMKGVEEKSEQLASLMSPLELETAKRLYPEFKEKRSKDK
jgi:TPR repeat protein